MSDVPEVMSEMSEYDLLTLECPSFVFVQGYGQVHFKVCLTPKSFDRCIYIFINKHHQQHHQRGATMQSYYILEDEQIDYKFSTEFSSCTTPD